MQKALTAHISMIEFLPCRLPDRCMDEKQRERRRQRRGTEDDDQMRRHDNNARRADPYGAKGKVPEGSPGLSRSNATVRVPVRPQGRRSATLYDEGRPSVSIQCKSEVKSIRAICTHAFAKVLTHRVVFSHVTTTDFTIFVTEFTRNHLGRIKRQQRRPGTAMTCRCQVSIRLWELILKVYWELAVM